MQLRFHDTQGPRPIPFLDIEGPAEVETVYAAATFQKDKFHPRYLGRNLLLRAVDLRRDNLIPGLESYFNGDLITRLEGVLTKKGRMLQQLGNLSSKAMQESLNHSDNPDVQRLRLIEDDAELAISAMRNLATMDSTLAMRRFAPAYEQDLVTTAAELVQQIDAAYSNPQPVE